MSSSTTSSSSTFLHSNSSLSKLYLPSIQQQQPVSSMFDHNSSAGGLVYSRPNTPIWAPASSASRFQLFAVRGPKGGGSVHFFIPSSLIVFFVIIIM